MIKRYLQYIKEADEAESDEATTTDETTTGEEVDKSETDESASSKFTELKEELKSMVEKTIEKSGGEYDSFVSSFIKNPKDVKIEGFINDSDIYEFYLKWRNDIDEILNDVKFFDKLPSELNAFGLYDYMIVGTQKAVEEVLKMK
jgi:hypothetical protein